VYEERGGLLNPRTASSLYVEPSCSYCDRDELYYYDNIYKVYHCGSTECLRKHEEKFYEREET